jgi:iron complex outermembrane receptor protein
MLNASIAMVTKRFFKDRETNIAMRFYNILGATGADPGFSGFDYPLAPREIFLSVRQEF